jgi:hypothetical protein
VKEHLISNGFVQDPTARLFAIAMVALAMTSTGVAQLRITTPPTSLIVTQGNPAHFTAQVSGAAPLSFQWEFLPIAVRPSMTRPGQRQTTPPLPWTRLRNATNADLIQRVATLRQAGQYRLVVTNQSGRATSSVAALTVQTPPEIRRQPSSTTVMEGSALVLNVEAHGMEPLVYRWRREGVELGAPDSDELILANVQAAQSGRYSVTISNALGITVSDPAAITVLRRPLVIIDPPEVSVKLQDPVALSAKASGTTPLKFRWFKNGFPIPGETTAEFKRLKAEVSDAGDYTVLAENAAGAAVSVPVMVDVQTALLEGSDLFRDRVALPPGGGTVFGVNTGAGLETGEPEHAGNPGGKSVWFTWTAPEKGIAKFDTRGSSFDTLLAVYGSGSDLPLLVPEESDDDGGDFGTSEVQFKVRKNDVFSIAVDGAGGASGRFRLNWQIEDPPHDPPSKHGLKDQTARISSNVVFKVKGGAGLYYQWLRFGTPLAGQNANTLEISKVSPADAGQYTVITSNRVAKELRRSSAWLEVGPDTNVLTRRKFAAFRPRFDRLEEVAPNPEAAVPPKFRVLTVGLGFISVSAGVPESHSFGIARSGAPSALAACTVYNSDTRYLMLSNSYPGRLRLDTTGSEVGTILSIFARTDFTGYPADLLYCDTNSAPDGQSSWIEFDARQGYYHVLINPIGSSADINKIVHLNWALLPKLAFRRAGPDAIFSWPTPVPRDLFRLDQAMSLNGSINWLDVFPSVVTLNGTNSFRVAPAAGKSQFYRLRKP